MRGVGRQEIAVLLFVLSCACVYGMKIDFSRLRSLRKPFILEKREKVQKNPCPADKPFLCRSTQTQCIPITLVCNGDNDCDDGFDENTAVCNAQKRPPVDEMEDFLIRNEDWIIPKLFDGADPQIVAHSLATSSDLDDLKMMLGITGQTAENLKQAFESVLVGDERPLVKLGMPDSEWWDLAYLFNQLLEGGLQIGSH